MVQMIKKYFPTEAALQIYNLLVLVFIALFFKQIDSSLMFIIIHLGLAVLIHQVNHLKTHYDNLPVNFLIIISPILLFSFYHYESGLINLVIFSDYLDPFIKQLDLAIFGRHYHRLWAAQHNVNFIDQVIHFFYFSYYGILFIPAFLLMLHDRSRVKKSWQHYLLTRRLLFLVTVTMLICYLIFIVIPVKGPTDYHAVLFPNPTGMVALMDFLYATGDTAGGAVPSSHVAVSFVITLYIFNYLKSIRWYLLVCFVFLAIGTTYCSYHYFIDVFGGLLTGGICYYFGSRLFFHIEGRFNGNSS